MTQLRDSTPEISVFTGCSSVRVSKHVCGKSFHRVICIASVNPVRNVRNVSSGLLRRTEYHRRQMGRELVAIAILRHGETVNSMENITMYEHDLHSCK